MKPILYNGNETDFTGNGIAVLAEALSCEVREVRNGEFELTLEYPVDGPWFKEIIEQRIVRAKPNDKDDLHNFRIYNVNKASSGETVVAQAATLSNDLGGNLVKHLKVNNATAQSALNAMKLNLVEATKYNFVSDISTLASTTWEMRNPLNCIVGEEGSLVDIWGGEVKRTDTTIYLYSRRGLDKVTRIRPRKGMTGFSMKTSVSSVVTRVQPYAVYRDEKTEREVTVIGTIVESPRKGNYAFSRILPVQYTENADGTPITTTAQLNALAKNYFTENPNIDKPKVEINADLIALADTTFYDKFKKLETIGLTDTIEVYVPKYDIDVELKITELVYNVLTEQVISLKAGDTSSTFYQSNKYEYGYEVNQLKKYIYTVENGLRNYVQISADGKNTIFRGYTEPDKSISHEGDLWFKEVGNGEQEIWIFDGNYWQPLMTAGINEETAAQLALAQQALDKAKADLKAVEDAMVTVDAAIADLEAEMKATKIATADAKKAASDAQIAADDANAVGKAAKEAGDQALSLVDQAQKDIDSANATIGAHTIDLSKLFSDFASMDTVVDAIVIDTGTMKTAISENEAAIQTVKTTTDQAIADNAADILTAQQLAESAKSKADSVEATTHTITQDLTTVTETITTIEETATSTTKTLNEVKSTVDGQVQTIATVKSTADSALSKSNTNSTTIDGIQTTLTSTKTTADSALSTANLAKSTADGNTTMISSVSSTANSALSKANTAQSTADGNTTKITAVTTTANNALTKANTLEETVDGVTRTISQVESDLNGLEIGGRNYAKNSKREYKLSNVTNDGGSINGDIPYNLASLAGKTITVSVDVECRNAHVLSNGLCRIGVESNVPCSNGTTFWLGVWQQLNEGQNLNSTRVSIVRQVPTNIQPEKAGGLHFYIQANGDYFRVSNPKIEIGNKATDWTPAPEDMATVTQVNQITDTVDSHTQLIASTTTTANSALTKATSVEQTADGLKTSVSSVKTTADSALSKATTTETTVNGLSTKINSVETTANSAVTKANTAQSTADGNKTAIASVKTTADSALSKATTVETTVNGLKTTISSVETTASNALTKATQVEATANGLTSTVSQVESDLNGLEIGGRNYAKNSRRTLELSNVTNNGNYLNGDVPYNLADLVGKTVTISVEIEVKNAQPQTSGSIFRIGCEASIPRASGGTFYLGVWENLSAGQTIATKRISRTLSIPNDIVATQAGGMHLYVQANGDYFRVSNPKIEIGNKATDWTPAPEDMATASQFTQLSDQIDLRVQKNGVINAINVSTEGVIIAGNKITITGVTKIDNAVIKTAHIADANISTAKIADLAVSNGKIANLAVTEGKIGNLAVTNAKIGNLAVDSGKIADASIITAKIGDLAVSEAKIANLAVTNAKIANLAVTGAKIANATIVTANIQDAAITDAKIGSLSATKITTGTLNASNVNVINLNASNITSGTISGANLSINLATGSVLFTKGKIANIDNTFYIDIDNDTYYSEGYTSASLANKAVTVLRGGTVRTAIKQANVSERIEGVQIIGNGAIRSYVPKDASSSLSLTDEIYNSNYQMVTDLKVNHNTSGSTRYGNFGVELYKVASGGTPSLTDMPYLQMNGVNSTFKVYAVNKIDLVTNETLTLSAKRTDINSGGSSSTYGGMSFGRDGSGRVWSMAIYERTYATGNGDVCITSAGTLGRKTSARKYKADIKTATDTIAHAKEFLTIQPASWYDIKEFKNGTATQRFYGFIADEFHEKGLTEVVYYGDKGQVEGLAYDRLTMYQNVILNEHEQEIQSLKKEVDQLKNKLKELGAA